MVKQLTVILAPEISINLVKLLVQNQNHYVMAFTKQQNELSQLQNVFQRSIDFNDQNDIQDAVTEIGINYKIKNIINLSQEQQSDENLFNLSSKTMQNSYIQNVFGPIILIQNFLKQKKFLDRARILNIVKNQQNQLMTDLPLYAMTNQTQLLVYQIMRQEMKNHGIMCGIVDIGITHQDYQLKQKIEQNNLIESSSASQFIKFLLSTDISDSEFVNKYHSIYDRRHHNQWHDSNMKQIPLNQQLLSNK